jgi:hypothetical protein
MLKVTAQGLAASGVIACLALSGTPSGAAAARSAAAARAARAATAAEAATADSLMIAAHHAWAVGQATMPGSRITTLAEFWNGRPGNGRAWS